MVDKNSLIDYFCYVKHFSYYFHWSSTNSIYYKKVVVFKYYKEFLSFCVIRFKELFLKQNNFHLFPLPNTYHLFDFVNTKTRALIRTKIVKLGYNDHDYNEFTAITNKKCSHFWPQVITLQHKCSRLGIFKTSHNKM